MLDPYARRYARATAMATVQPGPGTPPPKTAEHDRDKRDLREPSRRVEDLEHDGTRPEGPDERANEER